MEYSLDMFEYDLNDTDELTQIESAWYIFVGSDVFQWPTLCG